MRLRILSIGHIIRYSKNLMEHGNEAYCIPVNDFYNPAECYMSTEFLKLQVISSTLMSEE